MRSHRTIAARKLTMRAMTATAATATSMGVLRSVEGLRARVERV